MLKYSHDWLTFTCDRPRALTEWVEEFLFSRDSKCVDDHWIKVQYLNLSSLISLFPFLIEVPGNLDLQIELVRLGQIVILIFAFPSPDAREQIGREGEALHIRGAGVFFGIAMVPLCPLSSA
ncbi:MAG: hypothetical protein COA78_37675, partial [Blastopirellula sp.]